MQETENDSPQEKPRSKRSRRAKRVLIPLFILILVAAVVAGYWYMYLRGYVSTDDAFIDADDVTISSKILGRVVTLSADEGDKVEHGELLVQLDDSDLAAERAQAQANLEHARESVSLSKVALDRARDDFERASIQFKDKVITAEQYEHARQALEAAEAERRVALSQVSVATAEIGVVQSRLENTRISSPMSGVVARRWVFAGDIVQPGQPIFTIYDLEHVWVTANLEETKLESISPGDSVRISVDMYHGREFRGTVLLIGAAAASQFSLIPPNNASGNFTKVTQRVPVKISIDAPDPANGSRDALLLPGLSVEVKIRVGSE
jgi:membrane fusion protein (multidrug efflux system)